MIRYKTVVNIEWTNACNARCTMCPRDKIKRTENMMKICFSKVLDRLNTDEVFRVVLAGYGEPTIHPQYNEFIDMIRNHPVRFDMVSNGCDMGEEKLRKLDGAIDLLIVSFSSIAKEVYNKVHVRLNQQKVIENILKARDVLKKTTLAISLTPTSECLSTLPETIEWFQSNEITNLTMSPTLYNRAGSLVVEENSRKYLRGLISKYNLRSQELEFMPSLWDNVKQICHNKYKCIPRNVVMPISANGDYQYCFNDIGREHSLGNVHNMTLQEALRTREGLAPDPKICADCNTAKHYKTGEILKVISHYFSRKTKAEA